MPKRHDRRDDENPVATKIAGSSAKPKRSEYALAKKNSASGPSSSTSLSSGGRLCGFGRGSGRGLVRGVLQMFF